MTKLPIEQSDAAAKQAIWTGLIVAAVVFVVSFLYFTGKQTDMTLNAPTTIETLNTTGSAPSR